MTDKNKQRRLNTWAASCLQLNVQKIVTNLAFDCYFQLASCTKSRLAYVIKTTITFLANMEYEFWVPGNSIFIWPAAISS